MPDQPGRALRIFLTVFLFAFSLPGCDMIQQKMGLENPAAKAAKDEADGKAVGGACRQSGRAIEDCYSIYSWLPRAAIYDGWRDMDAYMRDNKLETVEPQLPPVAAPVPPGTKKKAAKAAAAEEPAAGAAKPRQKNTERPPGPH